MRGAAYTSRRRLSSGSDGVSGAAKLGEDRLVDRARRRVSSSRNNARLRCSEENGRAKGVALSVVSVISIDEPAASSCVAATKRRASCERPFFFSNTDTRAASWEIRRDPNQIKKRLSLA